MWVAVPLDHRRAGDLGADVIKLEDPKTGYPIRGFVTRTMGDPNARIRPPFQLPQPTNRNKRSVAVDLRTRTRPRFRTQAHRTRRRLRHQPAPRRDRADELDYATFSAKNPRLIYASINGYGHRGPGPQSPRLPTTLRRGRDRV